MIPAFSDGDHRRRRSGPERTVTVVMDARQTRQSTGVHLSHANLSQKAAYTGRVHFIRAVVIVQNAPNSYEPVRFDPKTLQVY